MATPHTARFELESTGEPVLDRILGGGLPAQSTLFIAGEPGSGKTILTLQLLFHAARQGKKSLYFTTISEPAIKVLRFMQQFDFFDLALFNKFVVFVDLAASIRKGAEKTLGDIEARVEEQQPHLVAIDSFRAIGDLLRAKDEVRPFVYDVAVTMAGWGATTLLVGEYTLAEVASFAEFAVADGIIRLEASRTELTSIREFEVLKMRGAAPWSGKHFFDITKGGLRFYPRVSAPATFDQPSQASKLTRAQTGVAGLDELLGGGLPMGSGTILQGATGAGKTLLSLQFLVEGARKGEKGVYFSLEESPEQLRAAARSLGMELEELEANGMLVVRYTSPVELSTDRFLFDAREEISKLGAARAVFDSLTTMALGVPSDRRFKELVYAIAKHMRASGVTVVMTIEAEQTLGSPAISSQGVAFIADNLIQLRYVEIDGRLERAISVLKARGILHESELRSMQIDKQGLQVVGGRFKNLRGVLTGLPSPLFRDPQ